MEKLQINKANWSGDEIEITVDRESNNLQVYDEKFKVEFGEEENMKIATINGTGDYQDFLLLAHKTGDYWIVYNQSGSIERSNKDIYKATAQVICNLI